MVKTVVLQLDDNVYDKLVTLKGKNTWKEFIINAIESQNQELL